MRNVLLALVVAASACSARSGRTTLPAQTRTAVLSHYAAGESIDQIARDLQVDRDDARAAVHDAIASLNKRYYADR